MTGRTPTERGHPPAQGDGRGAEQARCPACSTPFHGRPFCPLDGRLSGEPFSVSGRYIVEELLGSGGFSLVFGARHHILGKQVALKVLRPEVAADGDQAQRFLREARMASQLQHENIVGVLDFGRDEELDLLFLVMDRLRGPTLAQIIEESAPIAPSRALPILAQLTRALAAAHAEGVIHRDLNPRNVVLVESSGRRDLVKLCDFGLSRLEAGWDRITVTGTLMGTPAYMAPEQIRGEAGQDARVDLYALGVTAYEMLSGRLPYEAETPVSLISQKLIAPARPLREAAPDIALPRALEEIVMRCLAVDASERPPRASEVEAALAAAAAAAPGVAAMPADLVGATLGSYRITTWLGAGAAGAVYRGEHVVIGTRVAIKVLLPEVAVLPNMVERFVSEARASSQIGSPYIPTHFDFGYLPDGRPYAVMEYLEGETLAERLERDGCLPLAETVRIARQVASALAQAHAAGIVHRDIKPENLFLTADEEGSTVVKVLDFGIAKLLAPTGDGSRTGAGLILGTPLYCAPEQALGEGVGPAADIYALGATIFQMLVGRPPFDGEAAQVIGQKLSSDAPSLRAFQPTLPDEVEATVAGMLQREPARRPPTMTEVGLAIRAWPIDVPSERELARALGSRRRTLGLVAAGLGVSIALGALFMRGSSEPATAPPAIAPPPASSVVQPTASPSAAVQPIAPSGAVQPEASPAPSPAPAVPTAPPASPGVEPGAPPAPTASTATPAVAPERPAPRRRARGHRERPRERPSRRTKSPDDSILADPFAKERN
jgi:serine/threonine protein kinase